MKKLHSWRIILLLTCQLVFWAGGSGDIALSRAGAATATQYGQNDTWLIYWYICGTDLESKYGAASSDLAELTQVKLPPNVKILI